MRPPIFVRSLSDTEKEQLETALRSKDAFVMRRAQVILASERGERAPQIARSLGCGSQTARDAIHDFNERGLAALDGGGGCLRGGAHREAGLGGDHPGDSFAGARDTLAAGQEMDHLPRPPLRKKKG